MEQIAIIGGGLGGLTAGALLAKHGYRITLIEQHHKIGGAATTFRRKGGYEIEVGLHEMDAARTHPTTKAVFDTLGVYENVNFVEPAEFFRVTASGFDFTMPNRRDEAMTALKDRYPADAKGIDRYFDLIDTLAKDVERIEHATWWELMLFPFVFRSLIRYRRRSVREVLDGIIENEELKLVLNANIGYYHTVPDTFSMIYHALAQSSYYNEGGWYIKGGSQKLSDYLASVIRDSGGDVFMGSEAVAISVEGRKAVSVTYRRHGETATLNAHAVVSNLSPAQTYALAGQPYTETRQTANSLLSVYFGFRRNLKSVYGKQAYSRFFFRNVANIDDYKALLDQDITKRGFVFVDYSQIDSGLCAPEKSVAVICTTDFFPHYEKMGDEEYKRKKQEIINSYLEVLAEHYPGIHELVEYAEVGTPRTMHRYLRTPSGTPYGFAPSAAQFFRRPQVRSPLLRNLYFVGAWVIGGGFTPAIGSGNMCYKEIVGRK
ncbi:MAG TPA: NAD(P)/FAD-dependent oxidoreductase [Nitrospirota bacterium]|nr:NAD(P)/FAD-dependent oxidoreductase [Nitrospirota bacterium]